MLDLLLFCLVAFGITNIITVSKIGAPWRSLAAKIHTKLGELFHCPMCMGFWVGLGLSFWKSPTEVIFLDAILGSAAAWIIYCITWKLALSDPDM